MKSILAAVVAAAMAVVSLPKPAAAYPIDCAILLCLAGGWPPSAPCAAARAEFIRRITPWPIEPPLQIWRCPMGAAYQLDLPESPMARLQRIAGGRLPDYGRSNGTADIDISDPAFDVVRSIRVFSVERLRQQLRPSSQGAECHRSFRIRVGRYGQQGHFYWRPGLPRMLPAAFAGDELFGLTCPRVSTRAVFVDWRDHEGRYGFEQVNY